ncbi:lebocin-1/2-like [Hyposmocoma kahamanoa]|uniref:lebocin-1/2-like n=1 Tax=Hyposmocoma kahamanoa TaxID=1477025 RepID=UPI000E6D7FE1|nr:lebocin-1/2-like [Hyposmocoma kahamanoa]
MAKLILLLGAVLIVEASCQRYILPTYRPPRTQRPVIRTVRETNGEPLWLYNGNDVQRAPATGDHPYLPPVIDDIHLDQNQRYARSVDSPSAKRGGGSHRTSSSSRNTGPTHPGYNRRNARNVHFSNRDSSWPPQPSPYNPFGPTSGDRESSRGTFSDRKIRDVTLQQVLKKPTHRDVIIPNWNPNARIKPWQTIGVRHN